MWFGSPLWQRILLGMLLGVAAGLLLGDAAMHLKALGELFVRVVRMLVVPLVFVSVVAGITAMPTLRRLGSVGGATIVLYLVLTLVASALGLGLGALFQPGEGVVFANASPEIVPNPKGLSARLVEIVPVNPAAALVEDNILSVIFVAVLVGVAILAVGREAAPLKTLFQASLAVMMRIVQFVMELAPIGVFALIAWVVGTTGPSAFAGLFKLGACLLVGVCIQTLLVHGGLIRLLARLPVRPFFRGIAEVVMMAFSTSSSAATLPIAMRVAQDNLGVSRPIASAVLPIGVTLSMDGTALYVSILAMFSAQAFGIHLGLTDYLALTAVIALVALGAAAVPSASLFVLAGVLSVFGLGVEQTAMVVAFILPFDRPLDMVRTVPNCTSDLSVAVIVARLEGELDTDVYLR